MIHYVEGDATRPEGMGKKIIAHVCNDEGRWGKGFVVSLSKRYPEARTDFLQQFQEDNLKLGTVRLVPVETDIWIANMVAQSGIYPKEGVAPIRYDALNECLTKVYKKAKIEHMTVHMPRIGCGLAGGKWKEVEKILDEVATVETTVYDLYTKEPSF